MKNLIKISLFLLLATVLPASLFGQINNESTTLTTTATVLSDLTIIKESDISFGNISATTPDVIRLSPNGSASSFVGNDALIGKIVIESESEADLMISYPAGVILETGTHNQLYYHCYVFGSNEDRQSESVQLSNEGTAGNNIQVSANEDGKYFLYVGGALGGSQFGSPAKLNNQPTGSYSGEVVFEVKYN